MTRCGAVAWGQVCDSVSMYGFSSYRPDRQGSATDRYRQEQMRYHYYDSVAGVTKHHSFDLAYEVRFLGAMGSLGKREGPSTVARAVEACA
jgi:hypothetical protein